VLRIDDLLAANERFVASGGPEPATSGRPTQQLAVVTCMDSRISPLEMLGLEPGDAKILRNAGARVTDDVLRSLALANHALGVDAVVVMQHTGCGLSGVTDEELQELTGTDLEFRAIQDHTASLRRDLDLLVETPYLDGIHTIAGLLYDVTSGKVSEPVERRAR
jgi:carbonic anhydrase